MQCSGSVCLLFTLLAIIAASETAAQSFVDIGAGLEGVSYSSAAWGDYDNDGDLDVLLTGQDGSHAPTAVIYRNDTSTPNIPPTVPGGMTSLVGDFDVALTWAPAADAQTPQAALIYNLQIGSEPGGAEISSPMALASGLRLLPQLGNTHLNTSWTLRRERFTPGQMYYWSVQALDHAY
jgi:hypothetical protein